MLTLLIGGARSGKSTLAVQMAERHGAPVTFLATAEPFDDDLRDRIERHRAERPPHWTTVECPVELADAVRVAPVEHFVVIDCLTVWFGNLFAHHVGRDAARDALVAALRQRAGHVVVVTNEVGMGIHPDTSMGREYRDELGRLNQMVATIADTTMLLVAGRAMRLHDPLELL